MAKSTETTFRRLYALFTSDLSLSEIERLIKRDAPSVFDFYRRDVEQQPEARNVITRGLTFWANLFTAFLMKLHPARRFLYLIILLSFGYAFIVNSWQSAVFSFLLLNILLAFELAEKLTAKDELEVAREIQNGLMPPVAPSHPGYDIACFSEAALEVGGDYFDFLRPSTDSEKTYIVIGDVSGKGMGAALHMVQVQAILQNLVHQHHSPRDILSGLNRHLHTILRAGTFFTANIAGINADRKLHLCRAGHMPLLHFRADGELRELCPAGIGLGLSPTRFDELLEEIEVTIEPGDVLIFYTDGVVEMMNRERQEFGDSRLRKVVAQHRTRSAAGIQEAILSDLAQFRGSTPPHDDLTLIVMKAV